MSVITGGRDVPRQHLSQAGRAATRGIKRRLNTSSSCACACVHAVNPSSPRSPLSLASNPPHLLRSCHLFLSFPTTPPPPTLSSLCRLSSVAAGADQSRAEAEGDGGWGGARKSGMEGGVALFSRGEREDKAALTHLQTPTEICSTQETRD